MHKRGNELVPLIYGLELTINVSCTALNVKLSKVYEHKSCMFNKRAGCIHILVV